MIRDNKGRFMKGNSNPWNKGLKGYKNKGSFTSERMKGNSRIWKKGHIPWDKGKKRPEMIGNKLNWKGGMVKRIELVRHSPEYYIWRSNVFQRDNWTCQTCGIRGTYLEAHHIKELNLLVQEYKIKTSQEAKDCQELWDINNGVTLCKDCHNLTKTGKPKR
jgi:hypothetical protein